ncbi:MAG: DNA-formamidopyrimidine glycosylase [Candidatus Marinimicrobia bacterium]|nr:DNA-formamidopyrimidine glycosylase [Candidatus Neomarinimicrobiota bacterium]MBT4155643.1 DNA-formamidopyrimidine glycosylase [Candidatus Neomarinimicrobiota bacterium]MBT4554455.1 DNA-formamidopyrimidine glycosylase [Candidatus Neomarinimicrobiota bacterium]MBT4752051.1 DNA-formamidopyrimidine glycosylase [Candidatus Neomarinimicrobiota bacterium]MBT5115285.1 DNA-formamidopyrimidine glycosylase [Candidatus Neomarinimicrobiota bacterium]
MPELPEVQTVVDHLRADLVGEKIGAIRPIWPKVLHNFAQADFFNNNQEQAINDVTRRAKFIIIHLPASLLAIHLRMTGKLYLSNEEIPKHTSAIIELESGMKIIFEDTRKFGRIYLYENLDIINKNHGIEPLSDAFTKDWLIIELQKKKRNIKALLLDQSFIVGLGNIYTDESLWVSGIHPNSNSNTIPKSRVEKLHQAIQTILKDAIEAKGTTIINFSFLKNQSGNYANQLRIFGRFEEPCLKCGCKIEKIRVAGRGTYFCKQCQRKYHT